MIGYTLGKAIFLILVQVAIVAGVHPIVILALFLGGALR